MAWRVMLIKNIACVFWFSCCCSRFFMFLRRGGGRHTWAPALLLNILMPGEKLAKTREESKHIRVQCPVQVFFFFESHTPTKNTRTFHTYLPILQRLPYILLGGRALHYKSTDKKISSRNIPISHFLLCFVEECNAKKCTYLYTYVCALLCAFYRKQFTLLTFLRQSVIWWSWRWDNNNSCITISLEGWWW